MLDDADMDVAIKWGVWGRMNNAGQCCVAAIRFILDETIADVFLSRFKTELEKLVAGDPMDEGTTLAPLCTKGAIERGEKQVGTAVSGGAKILLGGKRLDKNGLFLAPTILTDIKPENAAYYQEIFAAVAMIFRMSNEQEAVAVANDSPYGLGGSVITKDMERGKRVGRQIERAWSSSIAPPGPPRIYPLEALRTLVTEGNFPASEFEDLLRLLLQLTPTVITD